MNTNAISTLAGYQCLANGCWVYFYEKLSEKQAPTKHFPFQLVPYELTEPTRGQTIINHYDSSWRRGDVQISEYALLNIDSAKISYVVIHEVAHAASYLVPLPNGSLPPDGYESWLGCGSIRRENIREEIAQFMTHDFLKVTNSPSLADFDSDCDDRDEEDPYSSWRNKWLDYTKINQIRMSNKI